MTRISLEISRLPQDVLTYTDEQFFEFIESFCGKDGSDLLSIQAIRSVDSLLSIQDVYSIFELDSDDVQDIQRRCGFRKRNGTYIVRPGIRSSLDHVSALLKEMKKKIEKTKKIQSTITQSTTSLSSSFDYDIESDANVPATSVKSKKNKAEHHKFIEKSIKEWCIKNGDIMNISDDSPVPVVNYDLTFNSSLDKVEIKCSCGLSFTLVIADSGNFKVKLLFVEIFIVSQNASINLLYLQCMLVES